MQGFCLAGGWEGYGCGDASRAKELPHHTSSQRLQTSAQGGRRSCPGATSHPGEEYSMEENLPVPGGWMGREGCCLQTPSSAKSRAVRTTGRTPNEPKRPRFGKANKGKVWGGEGGKKPAWIWSWRKFLAEQQEARGARPPHDSSWRANSSQQLPRVFWEGFV